MKMNHKKAGLFFLLIGILFGMETFSSFHLLSSLWPLLLTNLGAAYVAVFFKRKRNEPVYLILGVYIFCSSILFLYCNFTSWKVLVALWPLFIFFIGISFLFTYFCFLRSWLYLFTSLFFLSMSAVFLLAFSISYKFWWSIFIFLGLSLFTASES